MSFFSIFITWIFFNNHVCDKHVITSIIIHVCYFCLMYCKCRLFFFSSHWYVFEHCLLKTSWNIHYEFRTCSRKWNVLVECNFSSTVLSVTWCWHTSTHCFWLNILYDCKNCFCYYKESYMSSKVFCCQILCYILFRSTSVVRNRIGIFAVSRFF